MPFPPSNLCLTRSGTVVIIVKPTVPTDICPWRITGTIDKASITAGDFATIMGKVWDGAGNPLANAPVDLISIDYYSGATLKLASSKTDSNGNYSVSYRFDVTAGYTLYTQAVGSGAACANFTVTTPSISLSVSAPAGGPGEFTLVGNPVQSGSSFAVTYQNNTANILSAIIYGVLRNSVGQTIATASSSLTNVPPGGTSSGTLVFSGVASGTYTLLFFAVTPSGVVISPQSSFTVTI